MTPKEQSLKIAIIDDNPVRAAIIEDGLREAGDINVVRLSDTTDLLARISAFDPEVILIDLGNPSRDVLEHMFQVSRAVKRPVDIAAMAKNAPLIVVIGSGVPAHRIQNGFAQLAASSYP
jgi:response regulator NasT